MLETGLKLKSPAVMYGLGFVGWHYGYVIAILGWMAPVGFNMRIYTQCEKLDGEFTAISHL